MSHAPPPATWQDEVKYPDLSRPRHDAATVARTIRAMPTVDAAAKRLGLSRQALYQYRDRSPVVEAAFEWRDSRRQVVAGQRAGLEHDLIAFYQRIATWDDWRRRTALAAAEYGVSPSLVRHVLATGSQNGRRTLDTLNDRWRTRRATELAAIIAETPTLAAATRRAGAGLRLWHDHPLVRAAINARREKAHAHDHDR